MHCRIFSANYAGTKRCEKAGPVVPSLNWCPEQKEAPTAGFVLTFLDVRTELKRSPYCVAKTNIAHECRTKPWTSGIKNNAFSEECTIKGYSRGRGKVERYYISTLTIPWATLIWTKLYFFALRLRFPSSQYCALFCCQVKFFKSCFYFGLSSHSGERKKNQQQEVLRTPVVAGGGRLAVTGSAVSLVFNEM